jgi:mannose-1-phosphate guanylyltransferase
MQEREHARLPGSLDGGLEPYGGEEVPLEQNFHLWSIVLAGGEGERTKDFIRSLLGHDKPKQYCTFVGSRSLLEHTIDRADRLTSPRRRVIVTRRHHRAELTEQLRGREPGTVLYQPSNRGTAAGIFLPVAHALSRDVDATVVIYPSDHFVRPEAAFLDAIADGIALGARAPDRVLILGARPDGPETDYGWIRPGEPLPGMRMKLRTVDRFVEKPPLELALETAGRGGLWNTSIVVARAARLWELGRRYLPEILRLLAPIALGAEDADDSVVLDRIYRSVPVRDFSREFLEPATAHLSVVEANGFFWSDWGRPSRILEVLEAMGKSPIETRTRTLVPELRDRVSFASVR